VRGNNDHGPWAKAVPETAVLEVCGVTIYALHDLGELGLDPAAAGFQVVVAGHSHKPAQQVRAGVLYINPGSAGPRRFTLPVAVARLQIAHGRVTPRLLELAI
jgi:predicted phosphodiesterase